MPNNEPIIWKNLFPNQRNALVAEHVFGRKIINWKIGRDLLMARKDNPRLSETIPAYTESMDAAWPLFKVVTTHPHPSGKFIVGLDHDIKHWYETLSAQETATRLCIAALTLEGLVIDTTTEKTIEEVQIKPKSVDMS